MGQKERGRETERQLETCFTTCEAYNINVGSRVLNPGPCIVFAHYDLSTTYLGTLSTDPDFLFKKIFII